ncbi:MAG TPA: alpha/beta hydrolase [Rhizobiales bacterium]|nr:alpha/beta hydrolase [Hyphomicrobiales bacterium]
MPDKYENLLDEETWSFIRQTMSYYPVNSQNLSIAEQRECYDRLCRYFHAGYPDGVKSKDDSIATPDGAMAIRTYQLSGAVPTAHVVFYHGGGYVVGGLESHDDICAEICARTRFSVSAIDYRLAPEHTYPDDFNDALAGFEHAAGASDLPVVVVGDSAGGNLAAAVSHATRQRSFQPIGQVLIYPGLGSKMNAGSFVEHANAPMLSTKETRFYKKMRSGGNEALLAEPHCSPLNDSDFANLPPTVVISAQCDPLSGDGQAYHEKITTAGGKSHYYCETGLIHGYLRARHSVRRASVSFDRIVNAIRNLGEGEWPD